MNKRQKLILELTEISSEDEPWKWMKLWRTYSEMSMNRLLEIHRGYKLAEAGLKRRGLK